MTTAATPGRYFGQATYDVTDAFRLNAGIRYTEDNKFVDGISDTFVTFCGGAPFTGNFLTPGPPPFNSFVNGCASGAMPAHPDNFRPGRIHRRFCGQRAYRSWFCSRPSAEWDRPHSMICRCPVVCRLRLEIQIRFSVPLSMLATVRCKLTLITAK